MTVKVSQEDRKLLEDVCEMHVHVAPDLFKRLLNEIELAKEARSVGYKAILSKNHFVVNSDRAQVVQAIVPEVHFFGGVVLNQTVGGINPKAVRAAIGYGAKEVWMPTFHSENHIKIAGQMKYDQDRFMPNADLGQIEGIRILNEEGDVKPEVDEVLDLIAATDIILGTGHISREETYALLKAAKRAGVKKILVTHPGFRITPLSMSDQSKMSEMGAFMEYDVFGCIDKLEYSFPVQYLVESIKTVGPDKCVMATDLGQTRNPHPLIGMCQYIHMMLDNGLSIEAVEKMTKDNPARLLSIE
ncbi:MAG: DUF6282 family protein [Nitrososphaeria archaeon]